MRERIGKIATDAAAAGRVASASAPFAPGTGVAGSLRK
jgi:hypothetical protein